MCTRSTTHYGLYGSPLLVGAEPARSAISIDKADTLLSVSKKILDDHETATGLVCLANSAVLQHADVHM